MHRPVMLEQVLALLAPRPGGVLVDGTVGGAGHAAAIADRLGPGGVVVGIDRDPAALARAGARFSGWGGRLVLEHGNFRDISAVAGRAGVDAADMVLLDLGVSSEQLEEAGRGFSFMRDGPLDMRMDPTERTRTAGELLAGLDERSLAALLKANAEEPFAARVARVLARSRPLSGTLALAAAVASAVPRRSGKIHPATRTFQALRVAVNRELENLAEGLESALGLLRPGGRLAVISYHSIEDRIVKNCFRRHQGRWVSLQAGGRRWDGCLPRVRILTKKPARPSESECAENAKARSARLRCVERTGDYDGEEQEAR